MENNLTTEANIDMDVSSLSFQCSICGNYQKIEYAIFFKHSNFMMCDECKKDLKEIILNKRKNEIH